MAKPARVARRGKSYLQIYLFVKSIFYFLKRLKAYLPIIWQDREWDWAYILIVLRFKIARTRKSMENCDFVIYPRKTFARMKEVETLINRIMDDDYCAAEKEEIASIYGNLRMETIPIPGTDYREVRFKRNANLSPKEEALAKWHSDRLRKKAMGLLQRDKERLFYLLRTYMFSWWV